MFVKAIVHSEMRLEKQLSKLSKVMADSEGMLTEGHCTKLQIKDLKLLSQSMNLINTKKSVTAAK